MTPPATAPTSTSPSTGSSSATALSLGQAAQIIGRIDQVLELLPQAIKQAHERIIGERRVPNPEKILSIYEGSTKVIVHGKSHHGNGCEVEYGNPLLLGENRDGLIVHWELFEENRFDSKLLEKALPATEKTIGTKLQKIVTDRGFSDQKFQVSLAEDYPQLIDHICPRSPKKLAEKKTDPDFRKSQTRRAQTEARVAIITNNYQRGRSLSKGPESQRQELRWVAPNCQIHQNQTSDYQQECLNEHHENKLPKNRWVLGQALNTKPTPNRVPNQ